MSNYSKYKRHIRVFFVLVVLFAILLSNYSSSVFAAAIYDADDKDITDSKPVLTPHLITTGDAQDLKTEQTYTVSGISSFILVPIRPVSGGAVSISIQADASTGYVEIYEDENAKNLYHTFSLEARVQPDNSVKYTDEVSFPADTGDTYYLKITDTVVATRYRIGLREFPSKDATLTFGSWITGYQSKDSEYNYYKFSVAESGMVKVYVDFMNTNGKRKDGNMEITLLKGSKSKTYSSPATYNASKYAAYQVNDGDFCLQIKSSYPLYRIRADFTPSGSVTYKKKKKEAVNLEFGQTYKGFIAISATNYTVDNNEFKYYKVTIAKDCPLYLTLTGDVTSGGEIVFKITSTNTNQARYIRMSGTGVNQKVTLKLDGKTTLPKGTYYIGVSKSVPNTSGGYTIKVTR